MPLLAIKLNETLYSKAVDLVEEAEYRDLSQLVEVALRNHLELEQRFRGTKARVMEVDPSSNRRVETRASSLRSELPHPTHTKPAQQSWELVTAPFRLPVSGRSPAGFGTERRSSSENMYALVNRLFPLKLVTRWLEARAIQLGHWPAIPDAARDIGPALATIGSVLAADDLTNNRKRDEQLATSLPRVDNPKSTERFLTQFVARITDAGEIFPGGVIQFGLVTAKNGQLALTNTGQNFARLRNPLIDDSTVHVSETLTDEERRMLSEQIRDYMPSEALHLRALLRCIEGGAATPESLVQGLMGAFAGRSTEAAFRSHLSGVVARAIDLQLLCRKWEGRFVTYTLTNSGRTTLNELPDSTQTDLETTASK